MPLSLPPKPWHLYTSPEGRVYLCDAYGEVIGAFSDGRVIITLLEHITELEKEKELLEKLVDEYV